MKSYKSLTVFCVGAALLAGSAAVRAETMDDMRFGDIVTVKMMDTDKDGMVSKTEFMDAMGKMWDGKVKKMGVKGDKMSSAQLSEIAKYMNAGA